MAVGTVPVSRLVSVTANVYHLRTARCKGFKAKFSGERHLASRGYTADCGGNVLKAILTDSHFWLPLAVLLLGVALLVRLA
jgi:hypothetical protein